MNTRSHAFNVPIGFIVISTMASTGACSSDDHPVRPGHRDAAADSGEDDNAGHASGGADGDGAAGSDTGAPAAPDAGDVADASGTRDGDIADGDAADARDETVPCTPPDSADKARVCLAFRPDSVAFGTTTDIDGMGTLIVDVFDVPYPTPTETPLAHVTYPPSVGDGGASEINVHDLPTLEFDGLPETVYIRSRFIDNPLWFEQGSFVWGMFVGGYDLNAGVRPVPALRAVSLAAGEGVGVVQRMTVLRRFTTEVLLDPGVIPADDGQGPLSVGVFQQPSPLGAAIFGGAELGCHDATRGAIPVSGFFYALSIPPTGQSFHLGGQIDDFNVRSITPPGSIVSLALTDGGAIIPSAQVATVMPTDYSVVVPTVRLNFVLGGAVGLAPFACPVSGDAGPSGNAEAGGDARPVPDATPDADAATSDAMMDSSVDASAG